MLKQNELSFLKIKEKVNGAGNHFYQYRACRRDVATVYDIENIRHDVVFARTPLLMNDPFDSKIGFSVESIYDECIDLVLNQSEYSLDANTKTIVKCVLKNRLVGKSVEFIDALNKLKKHIFKESTMAHVLPQNFLNYITRNINNLYKKSPLEVRNYFDRTTFFLFSLLVRDYKDIEIDEKTLADLLKIDEELIVLEKATREVRDQQYFPRLKDFLSKLTVVCFSASGWDNQLMWAHYANSYSGICVEYDFSKMNSFIGFMYPVEYSNVRPTVSLKDLGITSLGKDEKEELKGETNLAAILSHLLAKNKCWEYEDEWRIINVGNTPYSPEFVKVPFIKSITLGLNLDEMCKQLIWDVCREKGIDCYQLSVNLEDYVLTRELLTNEAIPFDESRELGYIELLSKHIETLGEKIAASSQDLVDSVKEIRVNTNAMIALLSSTLDFLSDAYFLKISFNRYCRNTYTQVKEVKEETQIATAIKQINETIISLKTGADSLDKSIENLLLNGRISRADFQTVKKIISNIYEMVEKHDERGWFGEGEELVDL